MNRYRCQACGDEFDVTEDPTALAAVLVDHSTARHRGVPVTLVRLDVAPAGRARLRVVPPT